MNSRMFRKPVILIALFCVASPLGITGALQGKVFRVGELIHESALNLCSETEVGEDGRTDSRCAEYSSLELAVRFYADRLDMTVRQGVAPGNPGLERRFSMEDFEAYVKGGSSSHANQFGRIAWTGFPDEDFGRLQIRLRTKKQIVSVILYPRSKGGGCMATVDVWSR